MLFILVLIIICIYLSSSGKVRKKYKQESGISYWKSINDKGSYGEYLTFKELEKIKGNHKILTNVYLPCGNGKTTEIDLIYIHESGIYVIESKNYSGWIFGNEKDRYWTQVLKNRNKQKFYNPIWQNETHIKSLVNVCNIGNEFVKSVIVFSERCTLKNVTIHSDNIPVINRNHLVGTINHFIHKSSVKLSEERINSLYYILKNYSNQDEAVKTAHVDNINKFKNRGKSSSNNSTYKNSSNYKNNSTGYVEYSFTTTYDNLNYENTVPKETDFMYDRLEAALKSYRLNKSRELGIKPYMVFTDKEMRDIILLKPLNINELCRINGIGHAKCGKYGDDIVRIVNEHF